MDLKFTNTPKGDLVLKLSGKLDTEGCATIRSALKIISNSTDADKVKLDMEEVSFLDLSGIKLIVAFYKRLNARERAMEIISANGQPLELMDHLHIDHAIPVL